MSHPILSGLAAVLALGLTTAAQDPSGVTIPPGDSDGGFPGLANRAPKVEIPWNRLVDTAALYARMDTLSAAYPGFLTYEVIGLSVEGRELRVYTLTGPQDKTGLAPDAKPAMWIDGNIHGNEVQGGEAVVYTAWYLLENYGFNARVTDLVDRASFYLLPTVNPDGRDSWFHEAHNGSSSRTGVLPTDSDRDGAYDEDGPNDLDGDGNIVQMRKYVPGEGTHRLDEDDPRIMVPVPRGTDEEKGDWILLGSEGIDDDGDGRFNEDGRGGYDMNRTWPSYWMPEHIQYGAGPYPLYYPETRSIARFVYEHPNVAAFQTFHNSGGMILRGPGTESYGEYPRADLSVFDALGEDGEKLLPFYNYMIIWKDLYSVYGGEATWAYESLGIISFTNELWTGDRMNPDGRLTGRGEDRHWSDDHLLMGAGFVDWHSFDHPFYGEIEIGGFRKDVGRVPPSFLIEEMLHRNALFCIRHAEAMPRVSIAETKTTELPGGLVALDVTFTNTSVIPTRTAQAAQQGIGVPDRVTIELKGRGAEVLAAGYPGDRWHPERIRLIDGDPASIPLESGVPGKGELKLRWILSGGSEARITWSGEKGVDVESTVELR